MPHIAFMPQTAIWGPGTSCRRLQSGGAQLVSRLRQFETSVSFSTPASSSTQILAVLRAGLHTALRMPRSGEFFSVMASNRRLFCSFFMTYNKAYQSIFAERTWLIYKEEYLNELKWNCYLSFEKFALTEMAMEPF